MFDTLLSEESKSSVSSRDRYYWGPSAEDALNAKILEIYKEIQIPKFQTVVTSATPTPNIPTEVSLWDAQRWIPHPQIRFVTALYNYTQASAQREYSTGEWIAFIRTNLDISFANQLASRIEYLVKTSEEEFPEQEPVSPVSLRDFVLFLKATPDHLRCPSVFLTKEGNIRAEWTKTLNKHFAVEFFGNSDVRFVVFSPDPNKTYKINRSSGMGTIDSLIEIVKPYGIFEWVLEATENAA